MLLIKRSIGVLLMIVLTCAMLGTAAGSAADTPDFQNVSVHDPSIILAGDGYYYIFGSHMTAARSLDLMAWKMISANAHEGCTLVEDVQTEMREALSWAKTDTFWAPCVTRLNDGQYYMYYCCCIGNAPLSALGVAVSDAPEGPYKNLGILLKSGMSGTSEDGTRYNATVHPNAIDPHVFYDNGGRLWMVYGSYSGGIFILEMNPDTGFPLPGQGYGKKLLGKNHSRIEGPYILYSPDTEYYYLFLSYGGLGVNDGYNIRVARSKAPDGPYFDALGQDMIQCGGRDGSMFQDEDIVGYGVKLMGGHIFNALDGEAKQYALGFRSPGHNSAYYDPESERYFLIYHTRFSGQGETFSVRVNQMYFNADGWPVVSPHRYAGETRQPVTPDEQAGEYKIIFHLRDNNSSPHKSVAAVLGADGTVSGSLTGTWTCEDGTYMTITLDGVTYKGVFTQAWDSTQLQWTVCFTALSPDGAALWGSRSTANGN